MGFQEDLNEIKRVLANSKLRSELPPGTPENGDLVGFFNSVLNREERIEWSQFVGLAASAGITFEPNGDFYDVKVNNSTVFQVSKVGRTGQYSDILNAPPLGDYQLRSEKGLPNGFPGLNLSNQISLIHIPNLPQYEQIANKGVANGYVPTDSNNKIPESYLPSLAINDFILVTETDIAIFASNEASYTFQQGDVIRLNNGNGQNYFYTGGTKTDTANYALINGFVTPNLQQVSDQGATTNNEIESTNGFNAPQYKITKDGFTSILSALTQSAAYAWNFPSKSGTVALLSDIGLNYSVYTAFITFTGTNDPTVIILENNIGFTPSVTRQSVGIYRINANPTFDTNKVLIFLQPNQGTSQTEIYRTSVSSNFIQISQHDSSNTLQDGAGDKVMVEVRVYP